MASTILDMHGRPIRSGVGRNKFDVDAFQLANGAAISMKTSIALHLKLKNNSDFRQRLLAAQRMANESKHRKWVADGCIGEAPKPVVLHHIALLDNSMTNTDKQKQKLILTKHVAHGEKIARRRAKEENLEGSKHAFEKIDNSGL